jgi:hypothetical protein
MQRTPNTLWVITIGTVALVVFAVALLASLVNLWPSVEASTSPATAATAGKPAAIHDVSLFFGLVKVSVSLSVALLLLVVLMGALGSLIHAATSFGDFVGNRRFFTSWVAWYLLRPVVGVLLALLLYFAVRGGFFNASSQSDSVNPYGIAAVAGLAGLFSKQATDKLREVFETLFKVSSTDGDAQRRDDLTHPKPAVSAIAPAQVAVGATAVKVKVHGDHFLPVTVVKLNGVVYPASFISAQELELAIPDALLSKPGPLLLTLTNPPPGGGESQPAVALVVTPAAGV